jgi:hypothetical protein
MHGSRESLFIRDVQDGVSIMHYYELYQYTSCQGGFTSRINARHLFTCEIDARIHLSVPKSSLGSVRYSVRALARCNLLCVLPDCYGTVYTPLAPFNVRKAFLVCPIPFLYLRYCSVTSCTHSASFSPILYLLHVSRPDAPDHKKFLELCL